MGRDSIVPRRGQVLLAEHSSYRIGGWATHFALPTDRTQLLSVLTSCRDRGLSPLVFGHGSNILFPDHPDRGQAFISLKNLLEFAILGPDRLFLSAGYPLSVLALIGALCNSREPAFTYLMPGSLGGGIYINAKYGEGQVGQVVDVVHCMDLEGGGAERIPAGDCAFGYKSSIFQGRPRVITGAEILLPGVADRAGEVCDLLGRVYGWRENLSELGSFYTFFSGEVAALRRGRGELPPEFDEIESYRRANRHFSYPSCGSVFKNHYEMGRPVGYLVERLGLKGLRHGGAMVSPHHGNMIINYSRRARADDVRDLVGVVSGYLLEAYGFTPEPEVVIVDDAGR